MGTIEVLYSGPQGTSGDAIRVPLSADTWLGRAAPWPWTLSGPRMPTMWLQVRWFRIVGGGGDTQVPDFIGWAFRFLVADGLERAPSRQHPRLPAAWNVWSKGDLIRHEGVTLQLIAADEPGRFAVDQNRRQVLRDGDLEVVIDDRSDGAWPIEDEVHAELRGPLGDGQPFVHDHRALVFHESEPPTGTLTPVATRRTADFVLSKVHGSWELRVVDSASPIVLSSRKLRVLYPYFRARKSGVPQGGYLTLSEAQEGVAALGEGETVARPEQVSEYRARIKNELRERGFGDAAALFATHSRPRVADGVRENVTCIDVAPVQLSLGGDLDDR